jgi:outer membrane receptor protein involved in Fe transport
MPKSRNVRSALAAVACAICASVSALAASPKQFDIPAGSLVQALEALEKQAPVELIFQPAQLQSFRTAGIKGVYEPAAAIRALLKGTPLRLYTDSNGAMVVAPPRPPRAGGEERPATKQTSEAPENPRSSLQLARTPQGSPATNDGMTSSYAPESAVSARNQTEVATLQEVVVTAQKREEKLHDVPMGVTAITGGVLQTQRLLDFEDLESKVPGLSVQLTVPGLSRLTIRGENVVGNGSTVATYLDDVPFGSSSTFANGGSLTGDFDTWDLQRVEVLRGPQGTLYGASSEGGLFKYVTNPPELNRFASSFELGDEEVAHGDAAPSYKAMLNLPVGSAAALRLDGYYTRLPGYIDDPQLGETDLNRGYREGGRASFLLDLNDNFSIRLTAFNQTLHSDGLGYIDVVGAAGTPLTPPANQLQPDDGNYDQHTFIDQPLTSKYDIYSGTINWNLGWSTLTSITGSETIDSDFFADETSTSLGALASVFLPPGTNAGVSESSDVHLKKFTQEVRLASPTGQVLEWQVGGFYTRESSALPQVISTFIIPTLGPTGLPTLYTSALNAVYREWSAFGQITYHFSPAFDVALGGRWSENKQSENTFLTGLLEELQGLSSETEVGGSTGTDFLYSVAPRWHLSQDTMTYVRVATGYRPGGPNEVPAILPTSVARSYQSDSTINYEIGIKSSLLDNRLSVDLAAFLIDWKDIQLEQEFDSFGFTANGGKATSRGLEWSLGLTPVDGLSLTLTGAYVDAYLTADAPATGGRNGDQLPYAPKWSNSLDAAYTWKAFADYSAFVGATWSYIGSRTPDFETTTVIVGGPPVSEPRANLGGYNTINLRAGLDNGRWAFELYCKNLADSRGLTSYVNAGTPNFGGTITLQQPRTIGATIDLRF